MKFPFTTALGAKDMACILSPAGISPEINGVLVQGEEGIVESTMVRILTDVIRGDLQAEGMA